MSNERMIIKDIRAFIWKINNENKSMISYWEKITDDNNSKIKIIPSCS